MILSEIYQYILLFIVTVLTLQMSGKYKYQIFNHSLAFESNVDMIGLLLCIFFTVLIGLRPVDNGEAWMWGDTVNYYRGYVMAEGQPFHFDFTFNEPLWNLWFTFCSSAKLGANILFLGCDILYFGCTYVACKKWFPHDTTVAYLAFLGAFSTYSYSYNGVRAGVAAGIFLVGLAYYENRWVSILFVILSAGFHHSMQLPIAAYVLTLFYKNPKWYFYGWFFCLAIAILHIHTFQNLFMGMSDETGAGYLKGAANGTEDGTVGGFRPDFILYSAAPVWIGYNLVMKEGRQVSNLYSALLNMYLCTNGIWMLCMYANFTNRIAYLSWFMYPFVLICPFLKEDLTDSAFLKGQGQYQFFSKVFNYHLYFTLFMVLIFYQFLKTYK